MIKTLTALCIMILSFAAAQSATAATYTLTPTDDTEVWQSSPDSNYGSGDRLYAFVSGSGADYRSYLRFDLGSIPDSYVISVAELNLYYRYRSTGSNSVDLHYVSDDSWREDTVTWNNGPAHSDLLDLTCAPTTGHNWDAWDTFDLLDDTYGVSWNYAVDLSDDALSILIKIQDQPNSWSNAEYRSKEYSDSLYWPYLLIEANPIPIPSALWLLGSSLLGLVGFKRKFRKA